MQTASPSDPPLSDLVRDHARHFWAGTHPPFPAASQNLLARNNLRASPDHHRAYDVVWCYETDLADVRPESQVIYLDELLRLLGADGRLVVKFREDRHFTLVKLKRFLGRHPFLDVSVETEISLPQYGWVTVYRVRRKHLAEYASGEWSLAILTQGKKVANVVAFLKSVRDQDPHRRHEIIVCGPPHPEYEPFGVRMHTKEYSPVLADICTKKNDLADVATRPNLLLVHDRYVLDPGFFDGFERYGHDFDFLTVPQRYETGEEFPAYVTMSKWRTEFVWRAPIVLASYDRVYPLQYLNGGLLAVKTHTLRALRLNELLFWNQAEDCELAGWLLAHSLPPRVNPISRATVLGLTPAYTATFVPEKPDDSEEEHNQPPPAPRGPKAWLRQRFRWLVAAGVAAGLLSQAVVIGLLLARR